MNANLEIIDTTKKIDGDDNDDDEVIKITPMLYPSKLAFYGDGTIFLSFNGDCTKAGSFSRTVDVRCGGDWEMIVDDDGQRKISIVTEGLIGDICTLWLDGGDDGGEIDDFLYNQREEERWDESSDKCGVIVYEEKDFEKIYKFGEWKGAEEDDDYD